MTIFEIGSLIVAFIALVISILTFTQSSISTILNQRNIDNANRIAQKALDLATIDHKIKTLPNIRGRIQIPIMIIDSPELDTITLEIKNFGVSKVILESYSLMRPYFYEKHKIKQTMPHTLSLNNIHEINLIPQSNMRKSAAASARRRSQMLMETGHEDYKGEDFISEDNIKYYLRHLRILIRYKDELGYTFTSVLAYDQATNEYIGEPVELD